MRNWEELLPDVLGLIFNKLCLKEKLTIIPRVCKSWNHVVLGPNCWQTIDIFIWCCNRENSNMCHDVDKMLRFLVTRSSGALQEIIIGYFRDDLTFSFLVDHSRSLPALEIPWSGVSDSIMEQVAEKLSGVTRINLCHYDRIGARGLTAIGKICRSLVGLKRNMHQTELRLEQTGEAAVIVATMPRLKHLEMTFNLLLDTENVVNIIESCPELEFLDVRGCGYVDLNPYCLQKYVPKVMVLGPYVVHRDSYLVDDWITGSEYSDWESFYLYDDVDDDYDGDDDDNNDDDDDEDGV